jgi:hypothetical protein
MRDKAEEADLARQMAHGKRTGLEGAVLRMQQSEEVGGARGTMTDAVTTRFIVFIHKHTIHSNHTSTNHKQTTNK